MMSPKIHFKGVIWKIIHKLSLFTPPYLKHCTILFQSGFKTEAKDAFPILYQKKKKKKTVTMDYIDKLVLHTDTKGKHLSSHSCLVLKWIGTVLKLKQ